MHDNSKGTTVDTITIEKLKKYFVPLPPLAEQHRIVTKIEELFSSLDNIQKALEEEFGIKHSLEYISSLWRNKIPDLIAACATDIFLNWHYTHNEPEVAKWKTCSRCGETKLASGMYFSKNKTSKDGFYSICKECRNKKYKEGKGG